MMMNKNLPEAAHAASEIEEEEPSWRSWYSLTDILVAGIAPAAVVLILLLFWGLV